ncbi:MAG TPA: IclR family transcriptional regulator [Amycolatopsis sp.]|nr:IclR family transcriptional regulator [Amycolatopsis sp.]
MRTLRDDDETAPDQYSLPVVDRLCTILDLLRQSGDGVGLTSVVEATGMPLSAADRYLHTLEKHAYIERDGELGSARLGPGLLRMRTHHLEGLRRSARPWLEKLRDDFGETANLGVLDADRVIYVDIVASRHGVHVAAGHGDRGPVHSTALGKAIAAHLSEARIRAVLARSGMPKRADNTITSVDDYLVELDSVRSQGFAVDDLENDAEGRCVAVPLLGTGVPAAIGLSAPAARLPATAVGKAAKVLVDVATRIVTRTRAHEPGQGF